MRPGSDVAAPLDADISWNKGHPLAAFFLAAGVTLAGAGKNG